MWAGAAVALIGAVAAAALIRTPRPAAPVAVEVEVHEAEAVLQPA